MYYSTGATQAYHKTGFRRQNSQLAEDMVKPLESPYNYLAKNVCLFSAI